MILSVTFSKPTRECEQVLGKQYIRVRIWKSKAESNSDASDECKPCAKPDGDSAKRTPSVRYDVEYFTDTQSFRKTMSLADVEDFIKQHAGTTFKSCVVRTDTEEITTLANRHGETKELRKPLKDVNYNSADRTKKYILQEGIPVPFLVKLGVMTDEGKVISSKYDKFRQINRFLEFIRDVLPEVSTKRPLRIADFGCGKSYLTFAVYYYLTELEKIPVEITGLDVKEDVIAECEDLARRSHYDNLHFFIGNIADYADNKDIPAEYKQTPDIIITLHACDTATDLALAYAIKHEAKVILSVPCCQHEINLQLDKNKALVANDNPYASLLRYGLLRERFASLATDAVRAELLEQSGYNVQVLEFIDMEHTPKNILIRAIKKQLENEKASADQKKVSEASKERSTTLLEQLHVSQTLRGLLQD
jgi:SAM-dependent methyltransferase